MRILRAFFCLDKRILPTLLGRTAEGGCRYFINCTSKIRVEFDRITGG